MYESIPDFTYSAAYATINASIWHAKLGHPAPLILQKMLNHVHFNKRFEVPHFCDSCKLGTLSPDDWEVAHLYLDVVLRKCGQPYQTQSNDARRDKGQISHRSGHRRRRGPVTVRTEEGDDSDGPVSQVTGKE
ncbi:hypothetical protein EZV62_021215 [Acer yangbiense]|uniref:GAG-pre-integrase domain-containing protein n=1 Tax=Acer yangbiense TaxID=1000413 RepID=A0A5C7H756_9ROSI|nr:hypothetical protein EZV62_021215 [Acer yangbiense]